MLNSTDTTAGNRLATIEPLTKTFADARGELVDAVEALNDILEEAKRRALPKLKRLVAVAAEKELALKDAIQAAPELFEKPRTVVFHGIQIGLRKGSGGITWDDDERVCKLIEKHFDKAEAELLIKTTKKPIKKALDDLDVVDLKKIGCTVECSGDVVVVKATDSAVSKLVATLLKDAAKLEEVQKTN